MAPEIGTLVPVSAAMPSRRWEGSQSGPDRSALSNSEDAQSVAAVGGAGSKLTLTEFKIDPAMVTGAKGGSIAVTSAGTVEHNLAVQGTDLKTAMLKPGESATLDVGSLKAGDYTLLCHAVVTRARWSGVVVR